MLNSRLKPAPPCTSTGSAFASASYLHGDAERFLNVFRCIVGTLTDADTGSLRSEAQLTEETAEAAVGALLALFGDGVVAAAGIARASRAGELVLGFSSIGAQRGNIAAGAELQRDSRVAPAIERLRSPVARVAVGECGGDVEMIARWMAMWYKM